MGFDPHLYENRRNLDTLYKITNDVLTSLGALWRQGDEAEAVDRARDGRHGRGEGKGGGGRLGQG